MVHRLSPTQFLAEEAVSMTVYISYRESASTTAALAATTVATETVQPLYSLI